MKRKVVFFVIFILGIMIGINCYAKYIITKDNIAVNIDIDGAEPKIEIISIANTNKKYPAYASKKHTITATVKITENNIVKNYFNKENVEILVDSKRIFPSMYNIKEISKNNREIVYKIEISNIQGNGILKIKIPKGTIVDKGEQTNKEIIYNTNIEIDNIAPVTSFSQNEKNKKVIAKIEANEKVQDIPAWNISEDKKILLKEFECNVTYPIKVYDFAENVTETMVNITKATYIQIKYGAINEDNEWSFGYGNGEIAGANSIRKNPSNRTEAIAFYSEGNIPKDFFQLQSYINTYWEEGREALCYAYECRYKSGYNPSSSAYHSLLSGNIIRLDIGYPLLIGGTAMNKKGNKGIGGKPIPEDIARKHLFGISSLKIKLKDNSYYSVVYQIWVQGQGWIEAEADDIETSYAHDKPMGMFRMALIPKTEKQYLIDYWNKDKGTNNMK